MHVYNPEGFDPTPHLPWYAKRYADCARMLVHLVAVEQCEHGRDELRYVPLKADILRKQVHDKATEGIRDWLASAGFIDCDRRYKKGAKCFGFRLGPACRRTRFVPVEITDRALIRRNQRVRRKPVIQTPAHERLWYWLNRTEIDYEGAAALLTGRGRKLRNLGRKWVALEKLRARELFFTSDRRGRVYHNVACLWSGFRPFLRLDGERLVNLDIRNSQPLIFSLCLNEYGKDGINKNRDDVDIPIYYSDAPKSRSGLAPDVERYIDLTERGLLYDYLMGEFGVEPGKRQKFKRSFFANVFYSKGDTARRYVPEFAGLFPSVHEAIHHYKRHDYRELPRRMQRAEADLMIGTVCGRLVRDHGHVPFLTIHDSVLTTPGNAELIKLIMLDAFAGAGLRPTINLTAY